MLKLSDFSKMYYDKLKNLGIGEMIHSTRLKDMLLRHMPGFEVHSLREER